MFVGGRMGALTTPVCVEVAVALFFVSGLFLKLFWLMVFSSMCLPQLQARTRTEEAARAA